MMIKKLIHISNLLLIAAAVYFSVNVFYQFVEVKLHHLDLNLTSVKPITAAEVKRTRPPPDDYQAIIKRDLFKTKKEAGKKTGTAVDIDKLKNTEMNLKLWGTVSPEDTDSGLAWAVIEDRKFKRQNLYRVGDAVQQAEISEIRRNSVVLDVNGRKEKLTLEETAAPLETGPMAQEGPPPPIPGISPGHQISLKQTQIDEALNNINKLMSEVKIRPHFQDGQPAGFIMSNIEPDSVAREMGLKSGDIVESINGRQIQTAGDAMAFYESLKSGERLSLQLKRRGRPETIEYVIEDEMLE